MSWRSSTNPDVAGYKAAALVAPETTCARCGVVILPAAPRVDVSWSKDYLGGWHHPGCWDAQRRAMPEAAK